MREGLTWKEVLEAEKSRRDRDRIRWLKSEMRQGESIVKLAERLGVNRKTLNSMLDDLGLREYARKLRKGHFGDVVVKKEATARPVSIYDLPEKDRKTYNTLRSELKLSHKEALRRMVAGKGVGA